MEPAMNGWLGASPGETVRVEYRYIQAINCKGNRRIRVDPDGSVYSDVATRDCLSGEHWNGPWPERPVRRLSDREMARLRREIERSGFLDLAARIATPGHDGFREELDVVIGERSHSVTVERARAPAEFVRVRDALLRLARMA
jgi:hypothetical protein